MGEQKNFTNLIREGYQKHEPAPDSANFLKRESQNEVWVDNFLGRIKTHSYWTYEHSLRVSLIAQNLGQTIGLDKDKVDSLRIAGLMHDIGKIEVPNEILNNTTPDLTMQQLEIISRHPKTGFDLIRPFDEKVARIVVAHHEILQKNTYPRTNYRENDPELQQLKLLVALADKTDAGISKRPYKEAWDPKRVRDFLSEVCDPNLVNIAVNFRVYLS